MKSVLLLLLLNLIIRNNDASSFDLILNVDGNDNYFRFIEVKTSTENHLLSSSSSIHIYHVESDENAFNIATLINRTSSNSDLLIATSVPEELLGLCEP